MSEKVFWERLGIYPPELCAALDDAFTTGGDGHRVLFHFAAEARRACAAR